jgi:hypothetical protein
MWYRTSAQGYIRYEELANNMAKLLYPIISEIKENSNWLSLTELYKNYKRAKGSDKEQKLDLFNENNKKYEDQINSRLTRLYNDLRYMMMKSKLPIDLDFELRTGISNSLSGGFEPNLLIFYANKAKDEKELASSIEHELIHLHQFSYRQNVPFSPEEKQKLKSNFKKTNYYDLKAEVAAHIPEIMRELPSLDTFYDDAVINTVNNPIYQMRGENAAKQDFLLDLISNNQTFIKYLSHSSLFREMFYGKEKMKNPERANKLLKTLYYAVREKAEKLLRDF